MSRNQENNSIQPPVTPEMSCMDWISENKLMIILVILAIVAAVWYFWFREDTGEMGSPESPVFTTPPPASGGKSFNITRMRR
jgi:hypothetical protein